MRVWFALFLSAASAQEYVTTMSYSDANCTADARLYGYYSSTTIGFTCAWMAANPPSCSSSSYGGSTKITTCAAGSIPTPTSGLWQWSFSSPTCAASSAQGAIQYYAPTCQTGSGGPGGAVAMKAVCTTGGGAEARYYSNTACSGNAIYTSPLPVNSTCGRTPGDGSSSYSTISCYGEAVAPFSYATALAGKTCGGASIPTTASSTALTCFSGVVNASSPEMGMVSPSTSNGASMAVCFAVTGRMNGHLVRYYGGAPTIEAAATSLSSSMFTDATDIIVCTSSKCNSPALDACATAGGALPALTSPICGGAPASGAPPAAAAAPVACFNNVNATLALQATPAGSLCIAFTHACQHPTADPVPGCNGKAAGTAVRVYSDVNTLANTLGAAASMLQDITAMFYGGSFLPSGSPYRTQYLDSLVVCNTKEW